jgi:nucleotide-binding universal stress UspA family protein
LQDALAGTTAQRVLNARRIPVLIASQVPHGGYQRALVALDLSANSAEVLRAAEQLVSTSTTNSTVLYASELPYSGMLSYAGIDGITIDAYHGNWTQQARASVHEFRERESTNGARYRVVIDSAPAATTILRAVTERRPDLLVLGTQGRGRIGRALLGSVANEVLREAQCDVLIVPKGSTRPPVRSVRDVQRKRPQLATQPSPSM